MGGRWPWWMTISAVKIKWQETPQKGLFYLKKKKCELLHDIKYKSKEGFCYSLTSWSVMITKRKSKYPPSRLCERGFRENEQCFPRPTAYMCNLLYENAEHNSDNFRALIEVARRNISLHATLAFFWFRPSASFELGCMNHHIQNVSLICIFKHFFPSNGVIIRIILYLFWKKW